MHNVKDPPVSGPSPRLLPSLCLPQGTQPVRRPGRSSVLGSAPARASDPDGSVVPGGGSRPKDGGSSLTIQGQPPVAECRTQLVPFVDHLNGPQRGPDRPQRGPPDAPNPLKVTGGHRPPTPPPRGPPEPTSRPDQSRASPTPPEHSRPSARARHNRAREGGGNPPRPVR